MMDTIKKVFNIIFFSSILFSHSLLSGAAENDQYMEKGLKYYYSDKIEMAEMMFSKSIGVSPENYKGYTYLGDISVNKKKYIKAIEYYRKSMELDTSHGWNYFGLGFSFEKMDVIDQAEKYYKLAVELTEPLNFVYLNLGNLYYREYKDKERTIDAWTKYLDYVPDNPQREKIEKAILYLQQEDFKFPEEIAKEKEEKRKADVKKKRDELMNSIVPSDIELKKSSDTEKKKESKRTHGIITDEDF